MQKTIPLEPGNVYHIYMRGKNGKTIFPSKENSHYFLSLFHSMLSKAQTNLNRAEVLEWFGGPQAYQHFHEQLQPDPGSLHLLVGEEEL